MGRFLIQRLFQTLIVVIIVSIIIFGAMRILPGDPILIYIPEEQLYQYSPEQIEELRHELGLDRNIAVQYIDWIGGIVRGDFGESPVYKAPAGDVIFRRLPITMSLGMIAFVLHLIVGIPLGIIAAVKRNKWEDVVATFLANLGVTVPIFWLGILMVYLFGIYLNWLPTFGYTSPLENFSLFLRQAIMPVICLTVFGTASSARQTRSALLEVIQQDYIRTAWAKGLTEQNVVFRHALKNSLIPVITLQGFAFKNLVGGSVLVESVFNIPGMGRLAVDSMIAKDFGIVQGVMLIIALMVCLANLLVDILYGWVDPRIRY